MTTSPPLPKHAFPHEQLDCYRLAVEVAREVHTLRFPRGCADLRDQALRSSRSVVLNIAEGRSRGNDAGRNLYRIARASAAETCAVFDVDLLPDAQSIQQKPRRIGTVLQKLAE